MAASSAASFFQSRGRSLSAPDFDLKHTLESGQVFHWEQKGAGYLGYIDRQPFLVEQCGERLLFTPNQPETVARYFSLDHDLPGILSGFPKHPSLEAALAFAPGLRIIRQPLWECLATFITSPMKQVAHIRQISLALRQRYGTRAGPVFLYPTPAALARVPPAGLRRAGLGFRAEKLSATARLIAEGKFDLETLRTLDLDQAEEALRTLPGVGPKVAHCVLLFGLHRLEAFPVDVWMRRILKEQFPRRFKGAAEGRFIPMARGLFGVYGGYAQQYLFHHARSKKRAAMVTETSKTGKVTVGKDG